jgi:SAM-dependent methyltransferase
VPWTPFEALIRAVDAGRTDVVLRAESDDGLVREMPAGLWFRDENTFDDLERFAVELCRGRVGDVGAGVGPHALALQRRGHEVVAIDASDVAVEAMRERGVVDARVGDVFDPPGAPFDTLLLLMNGIGLVGTEPGLMRWLAKVPDWLSDGGQVLLDTTDLTLADTDETRHGAEARRRAGGHPGAVMFRLSFEGTVGDPFPWLFVRAEDLVRLAASHGFSGQVVFDEGNGRCLVRLSRAAG